MSVVATSDALIAEVGRKVPELTLSNTCYGHGAILRAWSGWTGPIPSGMQHGFVYDTQNLHPADTESPFGAYMPWSETMARRWESESDKVVLRGCAPWIYVLDMAPAPARREGTLFMPAHATQMHPTEVDWYQLARSLKDLPQPVRVCMYYLDMDHKADRDFRKRGYEIVSAGRIDDRAFLVRLAGLIRGSELVAGNGIGTNTLYSIASGTPFVLHGDEPVVRPYDGFAAHCDPIEQEALAAPFRKLGPVTDEQRALASRYLGTAAKRTPEQLYGDLEQAKMLTGRRIARKQAQVTAAAG